MTGCRYHDARCREEGWGPWNCPFTFQGCGAPINEPYQEWSYETDLRGYYKWEQFSHVGDYDYCPY
jgi:hypothetical protein